MIKFLLPFMFVFVFVFAACAPETVAPGLAPSPGPFATGAPTVGDSPATVTNMPCASPTRVLARATSTLSSGSAASQNAQSGAGSSGSLSPADQRTPSASDMATTQAIFGKTNRTGPTPRTPAPNAPNNQPPGQPAAAPSLSPNNAPTPSPTQCP